MPPTEEKARCRHYTFAHQALPSVAFSRPVAFLGVLASPDARRFLADLLHDVTEHCKEHEPNPDFTADDVAVHVARVGPYPCAVLEMPPPRAMPEAYFVAAVLLAPYDQEVPRDVKLRYFTLEKSGPLVPGGLAVLCEWTADRAHSNFGAGVPPQRDAFLEAIGHLLTPQQQQG